MTPGREDPTGSSATAWQPTIVWPVVAEHLSEATWLWSQWERSLVSPDHTLHEVEEGHEYRLLAHLEGLIIGGRRVAERLLLSCLESGEVPAVCVAVSCLLAATDTDWLGPLVERLAEGDEAFQQGASRALALSGREDITPALLQRLPSAPPALQPLLLDALRIRRADPSEVLPRLRLEEPELLASAIRAARFAPRPFAIELVRRASSSPDATVRAAALETGLILGLRAAWRRCLAVSGEGGPEARLALLALAASGGARELHTLASLVDAPDIREEALWALGFSGRLEAAEVAMRALRQGAGRLAVDSFAAVTGLPLAPPFVEEEEEESTTAGSEEARGALLPGPAVPAERVHVEAVERWWAGARGRFEPRRRYLYGRPLEVEALLLALEGASMRRRHAMALELAIRSGGTLGVEPWTWAMWQRRQTLAVRGVRPRALTGSLEELLVA